MDEKSNINESDLISLIPLDNSTNKIAKQIIEEENVDELKNLTHMFNLNQAKKNALRVLKLNSLLDHVSDEMIRRFERVPGEFSNSDLLNYMNVVQSSIDRANKSLNLIDETPAIQFNQLNVNINEETELDRESREKVADAVKAILEKLNKKDIIEIDEDHTVSLIKEDEVTVEVTDEEKPRDLLNEEGE